MKSVKVKLQGLDSWLDQIENKLDACVGDVEAAQIEFDALVWLELCYGENLLEIDFVKAAH